jgi:amidase
MPATTSWKTIAALHREKQVEAVPKEWLLTEKQLEPLKESNRLIESKAVERSGLLSDKEIEITERFTASELLGKIHRQDITSEEVVVAFSKRASLAQQLVRCIHTKNRRRLTFPRPLV